jgi:NadR type nicotinamide-nucleotide adenylyltransferase
LKKVVIAGVESTGKSTMTEYLSQHFACPFLPEYARIYLDEHGSDYSYTDFIKIAQGQALTEDEFILKHESKQLGIFDTDFLVINIWAKVVFDKVEDWIRERMLANKADLYLLLSPEVEWVSDGMREYPDQQLRNELHLKYIHQMELNHFNFRIIGSNDYTLREKTAVSYIEQLIIGSGDSHH